MYISQPKSLDSFFYLFDPKQIFLFKFFELSAKVKNTLCASSALKKAKLKMQIYFYIFWECDIQPNSSLTQFMSAITVYCQQHGMLCANAQCLWSGLIYLFRQIIFRKLVASTLPAYPKLLKTPISICLHSQYIQMYLF